MPDTELTRYVEDDEASTTLDLGHHLADDAEELVQEARTRARQGDLAGAEFCLHLAGVLP
jgi:hypothetical protein